MANFSDASRLIRAMRLRSQIRHSHESARYELHLAKRNQPAPISLPQWLFKENE